MSDENKKKFNLQNPLQLLGIFLGWLETAAVVGLFAINEIDHWTRDFVIFSLGFGIIGYLFIVGFVNVYLTVKTPHFLFNPSDFDKEVQQYLFNTPISVDEDKLSTK